MDVDYVNCHCCRFLEGLSTLGVLRSVRANPEANRSAFCGCDEELSFEQIRELFQPDLSVVGCNKRDLDVSAFAFWNDYLVDIRGKLYFLHHFVISTHCQYSLNLKDYNDCLHPFSHYPLFQYNYVTR